MQALNSATLLLTLLAVLTTPASAQSAPTCISGSPLIGVLNPIVDLITKTTQGNFTVLDGCVSRVNAYTPPSGTSVSVQRINTLGASESIFVNEIIVTPSSQNFTLKPGFSLSAGDILAFLNSVGTPLALVTLTIPPPPPVPSPTTATTAIRTSSAVVVQATPNAPSVPYDAARQLILVTLGPNQNYPNKPTPLNVSLYINNVETPELPLVRGTTYTFSIMAGTTHPFYLTTSIEGGKGNSSSDETVFLGNKNTFGTLAAPRLISFTPNATMPDLFYYQCYVHKRMGWIVRLSDPTGDTSTPGNVLPPTPRSSGSKTRSVVGVLVALLAAIVF